MSIRSVDARSRDENTSDFLRALRLYRSYLAATSFIAGESGKYFASLESDFSVLFLLLSDALENANVV